MNNRIKKLIPLVQVSIPAVVVSVPSKETVASIVGKPVFAEARFLDYKRIHERITSDSESSAELVQASCNQYLKFLDQWEEAKRDANKVQNLYCIYFKGYSLN